MAGRQSVLRQGWLDEAAKSFLGEGVSLGTFSDGGSSDDPERLKKEIDAWQAQQAAAEAVAAEGFDGRALRALIKEKWGDDYDLELTRTDYMGKASLYLNVMPWTLDREPCRHESEAAYLEHLEAIAQLLVKWGCVVEVAAEVEATTKRPRRGTIPLKTVPLRLSLDEDLVRSFRS